MSSLSASPYKGTRDWYPEDKRLQNYIFDTWKRVAERFGYEEYGAPLLEPLEVYAAKSGQEIVSEQTYRFTDRGKREVAIRPEMTPSISRMVAAHRQEMAYPARLYSIAQFMRYERPQRGREREFWQLNCDIFGADTPEADAEIIELGVATLKEFGAKPDMYQIKVNSRELIDVVMRDYLELNMVQSELMIKLFDRRDKISVEDFRDQVIEIFGESTSIEGLKRINDLLAYKKRSDLPIKIKGSPAFERIEVVFELLEQAGIDNALLDITLMRGFDYYTGTVFEFFDTALENNRSLFGGGRYDGLVGLFGAEPLSAVGFAPGLTMTELFLRSHGLIPEFMSTTEAYVIVLGDVLPEALKFVRKLRSEGVKTEIDITGRKIDRQIRTALKKQIPFMIFIGEDELKNELYTVKNTKTSEEQKLSFERVVTFIGKNRRPSTDELEALFD
jgi:histidyl-tRNA synthetase